MRSNNRDRNTEENPFRSLFLSGESCYNLGIGVRGREARYDGVGSCISHVTARKETEARR